MNLLPTISELPKLSKGDLFTICDRLKWPGGKPVCPRCGHDQSYICRRDRQWDCKQCRRRYTSTTGTILAERRMPLVEYFRMIAFFAANAKGVPSRQLAMMTGHQFKTVFRFQHLLRTVIWMEQQGLKLSGMIEIDGAVVGGYIYKQNSANSGKKRAYYSHGLRQTVTVVRQRYGRTIAFVSHAEHEARPFIEAHVALGSTIQCDMGSAWTPLKQLYELMRINHSQHYSFNDCCTNWAESYFARLRRMQHGIYHRIGGKYLHLYAAECAWREDFRKLKFHERFQLLLETSLGNPLMVPDRLPKLLEAA